MSDTVEAPWTAEQVAVLNLVQRSAVVHPFTCPKGHSQLEPLVATPEGWICPNGCDYRQSWAHAFMVDPEVVEAMIEARAALFRRVGR